MVVGRDTKIETLSFMDNNMELLTVSGDTVDPIIYMAQPIRTHESKGF